MILRVLSMFLGLSLALIHLVVGLMSFFIEKQYVQGLFFMAGAIGYAVAGFATIFNSLKVGLLVYVGLFFLDFFIMLYFELILEFFSCLLAIAAIFLIILQIRVDYFAVIAPDDDLGGRGNVPGSIVTGPRPDPLGFDKNYYYDNYYKKSEKKKRKRGAKGKTPEMAIRGSGLDRVPKAMEDEQDD